MTRQRMDFRRLPIGAPTRGLLRVGRCPSCGRNGELRRFADARGLAPMLVVTHRANVENGLLAGDAVQCWILDNDQTRDAGETRRVAVGKAG